MYLISIRTSDSTTYLCDVSFKVFHKRRRLWVHVSYDALADNGMSEFHLYLVKPFSYKFIAVLS